MEIRGGSWGISIRQKADELIWNRILGSFFFCVPLEKVWQGLSLQRRHAMYFRCLFQCRFLASFWRIICTSFLSISPSFSLSLSHTENYDIMSEKRKRFSQIWLLSIIMSKDKIRGIYFWLIRFIVTPCLLNGCITTTEQWPYLKKKEKEKKNT